MGFHLKDIVPWGRSFDEYVKMFGLSRLDLEKKILGCGDGPASFNAGMKKRGFRAVSCDPIYQFGSVQISMRIDETYKKVMEQLEANAKDYVWTSFKNPSDVGRERMLAMREFLDDYERGREEGRYVCASLPELLFEDNQFDLALSSHFLFLYSEQLSADFHLRALTEMKRVAGEVRIFPLLDLAGRKTSLVDILMRDLKSKGFNVSIHTVDYEFQRGGNEMMRIT